MASANSDAIQVSCPKCGAAYDFPLSMAGRSGRCAKCNAPFSVPAPKQETVALEDMPQFIGVDCRTCGTRLYGRPHQIGKALKCPDCYALTVLPPPPPPKKKHIPAAMFGDQYELAEPEATTSDLVAQQANYIAVQCRKCDTVMYATPQQVGTTIVCPDCRAKAVVPEPTKPKPKPSVLSADAPLLDTTVEPAQRPVYIPPRAPMDYETRQEEAYARAVEESRRTGKPMKIDHRGRAVLPRWPLIRGILPFFFSPEVAARCIAVTGGMSFGGYLISEAMIWGGLGGLAAISSLMFFVTGALICMMVSAAGSSMFRAVVIESSEGGDIIQDWGTRFVGDWFPDLLYMVMAIFVSMFPGWGIASLLTNDMIIQFAAGLLGSVVVFPIVYLSQLDVASPWGVLSGRILGSFFKCPGSWLLFYIESAILAALCLSTVYFTVVARLYPIVPIPFFVFAAVFYSRLLGRLAWKLAEAIAKVETK